MSEPEGMPPCRKSKIEKIKKTVELIAPVVDFDTTKVMTDEEQAAFQEQLEKARHDAKLAKELGRSSLMDRLKAATDRLDK